MWLIQLFNWQITIQCIACFWIWCMMQWKLCFDLEYVNKTQRPQSITIHVCYKSQTIMFYIYEEKKTPWKYLKQPEIQDGRQDGCHDHVTLELSHLILVSIVDFCRVRNLLITSGSVTGMGILKPLYPWGGACLFGFWKKSKLPILRPFSWWFFAWILDGTTFFRDST